jgi:hypothetical protein
MEVLLEMEFPMVVRNEELQAGQSEDFGGGFDS